MTAQVHDVIFRKQAQPTMFALRDHPLEQLWVGRHDIQRPKFDLKLTSCWRGYRAVWTIVGDRLFLKDLVGASVGGMELELQDLFPNEPLGPDGIFAAWVNGTLTFYAGDCVFQYHDIQYYQKHFHMEVQRGSILRIWSDNYDAKTAKMELHKQAVERREHFFTRRLSSLTNVARVIAALSRKRRDSENLLAAQEQGSQYGGQVEHSAAALMSILHVLPMYLSTDDGSLEGPPEEWQRRTLSYSFYFGLGLSIFEPVVAARLLVELDPMAVETTEKITSMLSRIKANPLGTTTYWRMAVLALEFVLNQSSPETCGPAADAELVRQRAPISGFLPGLLLHRVDPELAMDLLTSGSTDGGQCTLDELRDRVTFVLHVTNRACIDQRAVLPESAINAPQDSQESAMLQHDLETLGSLTFDVNAALTAYVETHENIQRQTGTFWSVVKSAFGVNAPVSKLLEDAKKLTPIWRTLQVRIESFWQLRRDDLSMDETHYLGLLHAYVLAVQKTVDALVVRQQLATDRSRGQSGPQTSWSAFGKAEADYNSTVKEYLAIGRQLNHAYQAIRNQSETDH